MRRVAVLRIIEQRDAVIRLGEIGEAMAADLIAGGVPGCVAVSRAAGHAVQRLVGRLVAVNRQREAGLQVGLPLMPGDTSGNVESSRTGQQAVRLFDV